MDIFLRCSVNFNFSYQKENLGFMLLLKFTNVTAYFLWRNHFLNCDILAKLRSKGNPSVVAATQHKYAMAKAA